MTFGFATSRLRFFAALLVGVASVLAAGAEEKDTDTPLDEARSEQAVITPIPRAAAADPVRVALGRTLFGDRRLSRVGDRSCLSCHDLGTNGADAHARPKAIDGTLLPRNTNTVFNAALSFRFGWDGRTRTLEDQIELVLTKPGFMEGTWPGILGRLHADPVLTARFRQAYRRPPDREAVRDAIATFLRTLVTPDSRFDAWLRGDGSAISDRERAGFELFRGIGCVSCHQGVNVGGNLFQKVGIFSALPTKPADTAPEVLRVPSLRNVAVTPPYFDNASAATLPEAVRRMARAQLGRDLTDAQTEDIVAFLGTLTGTYQGQPLTAPR